MAKREIGGKAARTGRSKSSYSPSDLCGMNPLKAQEKFKPAPGQEIKMHKRMAGA